MSLIHTIPEGTWLYRVTRREVLWREILLGHRAYYRNGARYNSIHQPAVYTTPDPIVAITEQAYYSARDWQDKIRLSAPSIGAIGLGQWQTLDIKFS